MMTTVTHRLLVTAIDEELINKQIDNLLSEYGIEDSDGSFRKNIHERPGIQNALEISKYLTTNIVPEEEYWRLHRVRRMDFMDSFAILRGRIERGRDQKN